MPVLSRVGKTEDRRNGALGERIARLRIELREMEPKIWRRIDMPLSTTLEAPAEVLEVAADIRKRIQERKAAQPS